MRSWSAPPVPLVPGSGPELRLHDTARQAVAPVQVAGDDTARMYVCGITPYDTTHLGHAATYLTFDLVNRYLRDRGHEVTYVQNTTDVDDPLFERAERDGVDWRELGASEIERFRGDMEALRILPPAEYVAATETVDEVVEMVARLVEVGAAYQLDDPADGYRDLYARWDATEQFGFESHLDRAEMLTIFGERGGDPDRPGKRDPLDALLWRLRRPGEPAWDSPWGPGRPGWHIECSAIARNRLGADFHIQGGGSDLVFPHHEFSAAHAEAAEPGARFARHYVHGGMIGLDGVKMSKSLGNLVRVSELRASGVDPALVRLGLAAGHYRADRSWSEDVLHAAGERLDRWSEAARRPAGAPATPAVTELRARLADDLDTPGALAVVDAWADATLDGASDGAGEAFQPGAGAAVRDAVDALLGVRIG